MIFSNRSSEDLDAKAESLALDTRSCSLVHEFAYVFGKAQCLT